MGALAFGMFLMGIASNIIAVLCVIFSKYIKEHCSIVTSLLALSMSVVVSLMGYCSVWQMLISPHKNPIEYQMCGIISPVCVILFLVLMVVYFWRRSKKWSSIGFVIDTLTGIIYLPALFFIFDFLHSIIE